MTQPRSSLETSTIQSSYVPTVNQSIPSASMNQTPNTIPAASQSMPGLLPGMLGNMNFTQPPRHFNQFLLGQPGTSMPNMNALFSSMSLNSAPNMMSHPVMMPPFNPMFFQQPFNPAMPPPFPKPDGSLPMNPYGPMPNMGRGQPINPGSVGILPGLMPLVHNMSLGRGRSDPSNQ